MKGKAAVVVVVAAGLLLLWFFEPRAGGVFPPCPLFWLTGLQCAGCGTTRALHALVHGHVGEAIALNPFTMLLLLLGVVKLVTPPLPRAAVAPIAVLITVIALGFSIARNLS
ncbi:MAG: DUF2752 domain-containing protein [Deltaproteobacteria bacterium]|nr:DUF2752 domain-containing protein [Deltaproteobacteria bacterium]